MSIDDAFSAPCRGAHGDSFYGDGENTNVLFICGGSGQVMEPFQQGCEDYYNGNGGSGCNSMESDPLLREAQALQRALHTGDMQTVLEIGDGVQSRDITTAQNDIWRQIDRAQSPEELGALVREEQSLRELRKASIAADLMMGGDRRQAMMMLRGLVHDELMLGQIRGDMGLNAGFRTTGSLAGDGKYFDSNAPTQTYQTYSDNPMDYLGEKFGDQILAERGEEPDIIVDNARNAIAENARLDEQNAMVENAGEPRLQQANYMQFDDGGSGQVTADQSGIDESQMVAQTDQSAVVTEADPTLVAQTDFNTDEQSEASA